MELEQYELAMEEQAYPFEEKAIHVHESNLKLITRGVYNAWIDKSLRKLAEFVPARYDKPEETSGIVSSLETYIYEIDRPALSAMPESESGEPVHAEESGPVDEFEPEKPAQVEEPASVAESEPEKSEQIEKAGSVGESESAKTAQVKEPMKAEEPGYAEQSTGEDKHTKKLGEASTVVHDGHGERSIERQGDE